MESHLNIEEIEQYLDGTLQGTDLKAFEERLLNDKSLASRVELMKKIDHSIEDEKAMAAQKAIMEIGDEFFKKKSTIVETNTIQKRPFYRRPLAMAACFLLAVTLGIILWSQMKPSSLSNQELYASYYVPYHANDASRGETGNATFYNLAVQQYQSKEYTKAIASFQKVLLINPTDNQVLYCLAHAYLNETPPALGQASKYFEQIIKDGKSIRVAKSKWYLALIYLKQNETVNAQKLLNELIGSEDDKMANQAKELLQRMDK